MTAGPRVDTTPTRRMLVVLALALLLIPAVLTALLVAGAARAEPNSSSGGTARQSQWFEPSIKTTIFGKDAPGA